MITKSEPEIRKAILAHPGLTDRQIGNLVGVRLWSKVRKVREAMAAEAAAPPAGEPPQLLSADVPAASDLTSPQPPPAMNPTVICQNCRREGTPAPARPEWCKLCASDPVMARHRASWPRPELSLAAQISLDLLGSFANNPAAADLLRRRYLAARAGDYNLLEVSS